MKNKEHIVKDIENVGERKFAPPPRPNLPVKRSLEENKQAIGPLKNKKVKQTKKTSIEKKQGREIAEKQTKKNKFNFKILIAIACIVVVIFVAVLIVVNRAKENAQLQISSSAAEITIVKSQDDYYIIAPVVEKADIYIFEIKSAYEDITKVESNTNVATITGAFDVKQAYSLRFYVQRKGNEKTKSKPTEWVDYIASTKLLQPQINYNENSQTLVWFGVINVDYYNLYYSSKTGVEVKKITTLPNQDGEVVVDFDSLGLEYGQYEISVVAISNNQNIFLPSNASNKLVINYFYKLPKVSGASYNFENNILTIQMDEIIDNAKIKITHEGGSFTFPTIKEVYEYSINVSDYNNLSFESGQEIFVSLVSNEQFVIESEKVLATFSN
jgi:competence protein ComGC